MSSDHRDEWREHIHARRSDTHAENQPVRSRGSRNAAADHEAEVTRTLARHGAAPRGLREHGDDVGLGFAGVRQRHVELLSQLVAAGKGADMSIFDDSRYSIARSAVRCRRDAL
jgi:hypothetical protein